MAGSNRGWMTWLALPLAAYGLERAAGFAESRRGALPGDELVPVPMFQTTHDTVIDAVPGRVWPWLAQMGAGRAGWYADPGWWDAWGYELLFGAPGADGSPPTWRTPSADRLRPELQDIKPGDILADGPPGTAYFEVEIAEPERVLALLSDTHLAHLIPPSWHAHVDVGGTFSWVFALEPLEDGRTRLTIRTRATFHPRAAMALMPLVRAIDYLTVHRMLDAIKRRAERTVPAGQGHPIRRPVEIR